MLSRRLQSSRRPLAESFQEPWWVAQMTEAERAQAAKAAATPPPADQPALGYGAGLDLGQAADYSVLAQVVWDTAEPEPVYTVWALTRWPLNTAYSAVANDTRELLARVPGQRRPALAADRTGVGRPVLELFDPTETAFDLHPILITAGAQITRDDEGCWHVPKRELIFTLVALFTAGRLRINPEVPLAGVLAQELRDFTMKVSKAGNETFSAMTERVKDDCVLAAAMAVWLAEHRPTGVLDAYV
jgi:hypothetical protein